MARSLKESNKLKKAVFLLNPMKERKKERRTHAITGGFNSDGTVNPISNIRNC